MLKNCWPLLTPACIRVIQIFLGLMMAVNLTVTSKSERGLWPKRRLISSPISSDLLVPKYVMESQCILQAIQLKYV